MEALARGRRLRSLAVMGRSSAGLALVVASFVALPQDPPPDAATLARAEQLGQPGERHGLLQRLVGEWDVAVKTPTADGERVDRGSAKGQALLGGRYVQLQFALTVARRPFEAVQVLGFDQLRQQFTSSWIDSASTWATACAGAPRADRPDLLALSGTLVDAVDPGGRQFRLEVDLAFDQRVTVKLFETRGGAESLAQTQTWTRR